MLLQPENILRPGPLKVRTNVFRRRPADVDSHNLTGELENCCGDTE